ncbi:MAG: hydrogenase [Candidatus Poribacteria bacterium]|nr:MAG: hydrogenase [Candidatus Poribacteria bacterium]
MCMAIPMRLVEKNGEHGVVELGGLRQAVNLSLVDAVEVGQYVIVHAGFAIQTLDEEEARRTLETFAALAEAAAG